MMSLFSPETVNETKSQPALLPIFRMRDDSKRSPIQRLLALFIGVSFLTMVGCATTKNRGDVETKVAPEIQTLRTGDSIRIAFPDAPNLDSSQTIRRDGKITLALVGEMKVTDKTPAQLEKDLAQAYASQLRSKEVSVTVLSSSFTVIVNGAVGRAGKISADHALTAFEAVMEAGGFAPNAYSRGVIIIRQEEGGGTKNYEIDLKAVLDGKKSEPFYLKSNDVIIVKEKFNWF